MHFTLAVFTPAEVAKITTLSPEMQRDWRKRGLMPDYAASSRSVLSSEQQRNAQPVEPQAFGSRKKHSRYNITELIEIWIMKMFADRAIGPQVSKQFAKSCATAVLYNALKFGPKSVYAFEKWDLNADSPEVTLANEKHQYGLADLVATSLGWSHARTGMFVWWPNGLSEFTDVSVWETTDTSDDRFLGPAIVLDLYAIGDAVSRRAEKPLIEMHRSTTGARPE